MAKEKNLSKIQVVDDSLVTLNGFRVVFLLALYGRGKLEPCRNFLWKFKVSIFLEVLTLKPIFCKKKTIMLDSGKMKIEEMIGDQVLFVSSVYVF